MKEALDAGFMPADKKINPFLTWWVMLIYGFLLLIAGVFKIQHWPGGEVFTLLFSGLIQGYVLARIVEYPKYLILKIILGIIMLLWIATFFWGWVMYSPFGLIPFGLGLLPAFFISWARAKKEFK